MSKPDAWMPLYIGDYLADTMHLDAAGHGAYLLLIMHYWRTARPLPSDDAALARIARCSPDLWGSLKVTLSVFFKVSETEWRHSRIDTELAKAAEGYEKRRARSQSANAAKTNKTRPAENLDGHQQGGLGGDLQGTNKDTFKAPNHNHNHSKYSEAKASGAPSAPEPDLMAIPLRFVSPPEGDWSRALFGPGLEWVAGVTDKPPGKVRSLVGRWLRAAGQDHRAVFGLLADAQERGVAQPVEWIERALANAKTDGHRNGFAELIATGQV